VVHIYLTLLNWVAPGCPVPSLTLSLHQLNGLGAARLKPVGNKTMTELKLNVRSFISEALEDSAKPNATVVWTTTTSKSRSSEEVTFAQSGHFLETCQ
jgi:hypothetical protein